MTSVTKWTLVGLVILLGDRSAVATEQPHSLISPAETTCKAPAPCKPAVNVSPENRLQHAKGTEHGGTSQEPHNIVLPGKDLHRSGGDENASGNSHPPGRFACGEVVDGYTVDCTHGAPRNPVSAPELDATDSVGGVMIVIGCLAILQERRRRNGTICTRR